MFMNSTYTTAYNQTKRRHSDWKYLPQEGVHVSTHELRSSLYGLCYRMIS